MDLISRGVFPTSRNLVLALVLAMLACRPGAPPEATAPLPADGTPRLVLVLVVDQLPYDHLVRFRPLLTGGLGRLLAEGASFTDAHHFHAVTATAPGHATLITGVHPSRHGVVGNRWLERDADGEPRGVYCVGDEEHGRSPANLLASTLGDWMDRAWPEAKIFAASGKDRGAVLTAGHRADGAYWYDRETGRFVSSSYYPAAEPPWLEAFHREHGVGELFGETWKVSPEVVERGAEFGVAELDRGLLRRTFPHPLGEAALVPDEDFYTAVYGSPFQDRYLLDLARAMIEGEDLGGDAWPDFLGLSFSAMDAVGHDYGPDSPELLDTLLRLDRVLGELLEYVDRRVGLEHTLISLSADHGIPPVPEVLAARGGAGRRFGAAEITCVQRAGREISRRLGREDWVSTYTYLDPGALAAAGAEPAAVAAELARGLEACPGVARAWTAADLTTPASADDPFRAFYAHNYYPGRSPDVMVQLEPHTLPDWDAETDHGSPYPYDTHVPWLLRRPGGGAGEVGERVHTVDVAPTLAALLGLEAPPGLDGADRSPALP